MTNTLDIPYYSYRDVLSRNGLYNFCVGGRGIGKTFGAIKLAVRDYLRKGEQFIYLRRYEDEMIAAKSTFGNDLLVDFPDHTFRVYGNEFQYKRVHPGVYDEETGKTSKDIEEWEVAGYFRVLSKAQAQKSVAFPRVTKIIFDEFIIEKGFQRYLPNEHIAFNNFYYTVNRSRNNTRVFFLANSVSINNPYFDEYDIRPDQLPEISSHFPVIDPNTKNKRPFIVVHFIDSKEFEDAAYATVFGQFIKGTDYAKYAVENNFNDGHNELIGGKSANAKYKYSLETPKLTFSVWYDREQMLYYVLRKRPKRELTFTLIAENMGEDKTLMKLNDKPMQVLRSAFSNARIFFDQPRTRNAFVAVLRN